mmetsp:Transcript_42387/g.111590  ORF Transcript_42387/g.111590 Transcript_42387/m.111590 type:complete len:444 (+) Transcript_42387:236-1567(+)
MHPRAVVEVIDSLVAGVKKQACLARRCIQLKREDPHLVARAQKRARSMSDMDMAGYGFQAELNELDEFDLPPELFYAPSMRLSSGDGTSGSHSQQGVHYNVQRAGGQVAMGRPKSVASGTKADKKRGALQRCGQCGPCTRTDCGACQNCHDKPKFGGPGLRKQACEKKRCLTMTTRYATPSPPLTDDLPAIANKSDSPTGAEKLVPLSTHGGGVAAAWQRQLDQLDQLSQHGASAPLPALRTGMASGLSHGLAGIQSSLSFGSSLNNNLGTLAGSAMGSLGGMHASALSPGMPSGLGNLGGSLNGLANGLHGASTYVPGSATRAGLSPKSQSRSSDSFGRGGDFGHDFGRSPRGYASLAHPAPRLSAPAPTPAPVDAALSSRRSALSIDAPSRGLETPDDVASYTPSAFFHSDDNVIRTWDESGDKSVEETLVAHDYEQWLDF